MIHCHNLVHEDHDMMVQFSRGRLTNNDPVTTDPPVLDTTPVDSVPAGVPARIPGGDLSAAPGPTGGRDPAACWR